MRAHATHELHDCRAVHTGDALERGRERGGWGEGKSREAEGWTQSTGFLGRMNSSDRATSPLSLQATSHASHILRRASSLSYAAHAFFPFHPSFPHSSLLPSTTPTFPNPLPFPLSLSFSVSLSPSPPPLSPASPSRWTPTSSRPPPMCRHCTAPSRTCAVPC